MFFFFILKDVYASLTILYSIALIGRKHIYSVKLVQRSYVLDATL